MNPVVLSGRGRVARWAAAGVVLTLLTAGTVVGQDSDFPFGPFRMYATRDDPNGTAYQAVVLAKTSDGRTHDVTNTSGAPRRAEIEGRMSEFQDDPARFAAVAPAYAHAIHGVRVTMVLLAWRGFALTDGISRAPVDRTIATWTAGS